MKIKLFKTRWGAIGTYEQSITEAVDAKFDGIEGPAPADSHEQQSLLSLLHEHQLEYIAEITTAGTYVPDRNASLQQHLDTLEEKLEHSASLNPLLVNCLGGCDAWPEQKSFEFFHHAIELAEKYQLKICFETHRSRSLFNPWITQRLVEALPQIQLTVDFSHWCVVCERLMDTELDVINAIANNIHHIHARIGYEQGPQVPDPRAPEYRYALEAHQRWWEIIWSSQLKRKFSSSTMTPEFGPDGYLHEMPFSKEPVADLWKLNKWMAAEEKSHFQRFMQS